MSNLLLQIFAEVAKQNYKLKLRCARGQENAQINLFATNLLTDYRTESLHSELKHLVSKYEKVTKKTIARLNEAKYLSWNSFSCDVLNHSVSTSLDLDTTTYQTITPEQIERIRLKCNLTKPLKVPNF